MGYQAPLEFIETQETQWVGEHRPEFVDLEAIFRRLVALDIPALGGGVGPAAEAWRAVLPDDVHIIRMLSPRAVHVHIPRAVLVRDVVLKAYLPHAEGTWRRLTARVERSRSHRAHLWAHRLRAIGIDTPRPLGYVERSKKPAQYASFAATEYVLAPALIELKDTGMSMLRVPRGSAVAEKRALIGRVATVFRSLHAHGMFHGEVSAAGFLVAGTQVLVLDTHALRSSLRAGRAAVEVLAGLQRAFRDARALSRTDRMRFLRTYLKHDADGAARARRLWDEVVARA